MYTGQPNLKGQFRIVEYETGRDVTDKYPFIIRSDYPNEPAYKDAGLERYQVWMKYMLTKEGVPNTRFNSGDVLRYFGTNSGAPYFILDEDRERKAQPIRDRIAELHARLGAAKRELANVYRHPDKQKPVTLTGNAKVDAELDPAVRAKQEREQWERDEGVR